jgi:hypothetical protein
MIQKTAKRELGHMKKFERSDWIVKDIIISLINISSTVHALKVHCASYIPVILHCCLSKLQHKNTESYNRTC